jgi:hypothetical protein
MLANKHRSLQPLIISSYIELALNGFNTTLISRKQMETMLITQKRPSQILYNISRKFMILFARVDYYLSQSFKIKEFYGYAKNMN